MNSLCLAEILRHFPSSSHELIKSSAEKGSNPREPSLHSTGAEDRLTDRQTDTCQGTQRALLGETSQDSAGTSLGSQPCLHGFVRKPEIAKVVSPSTNTLPVSEALTQSQQLMPQDISPWSCAVPVLNLGEPLRRCSLRVVSSAAEVKPMVSLWSCWPQRAVLLCKGFPFAA